MGKTTIPKLRKKAPGPYAAPAIPNPDVDLILAKIGGDVPAMHAFLRLATAQNIPTAIANDDNEIDDDDDDVEDAPGPPKTHPPVSPAQLVDSSSEVIDLKNQISLTLAQLRDAEIDLEGIEKNFQDGIIPPELIPTANAELEKSRSRKTFLLSLHANQQSRLNNVIATLTAAQSASASISSPLAAASTKKGKQPAYKLPKQEEDNPKPISRTQELWLAKLSRLASISVGERAPPEGPIASTSEALPAQMVSAPPRPPSLQPPLPLPQPNLQSWNLLAGFANAPPSESIPSPSSSTISIRIPRKKVSDKPSASLPSRSPSVDFSAVVTSPSKKSKARSTKNSLKAAAEALAIAQPPTDEIQSSFTTPSTLTAGDSFDSENQLA